MAAEGNVALIENILQFIGAFVSLSIAYVSYKGVRETESATLLRLTTAFTLLGFGFVVEGIVGLWSENLLPGVAAMTTTLVIAGLFLETSGYFFLAFSHVVDVLLAKRLGLALALFPVINLTSGQLGDVLTILSFYFVLYGMVETLYSYKRNGKPDTLMIAGGLAFIAMGTFLQWISMIYPPFALISLLQILAKEIGLMMLFVPVLQFSLGRKWNGPV